MQEMCEANPVVAKNLEQQILGKAQGAFLRVTFATKSILEGLMEGEKPEDIEKRLRDLLEWYNE